MSMLAHRVVHCWLGAVLLTAGWPFAALAQGLGQSVDQGIRNPTGQGIEQAVAAHVITTIMALLFWSGVVGLAALAGFGGYGLVAARDDLDRREQAARRVRWGAVGLAAWLAAGAVGWLIFFR